MKHKNEKFFFVDHDQNQEIENFLKFAFFLILTKEFKNIFSFFNFQIWNFNDFLSRFLKNTDMSLNWNEFSHMNARQKFTSRYFEWTFRKGSFILNYWK